MEKQLDELDENLVSEVQLFRTLLGGNPENDLIFHTGEEEGYAFIFFGTVDEIRACAERNKILLLCLQGPEIEVPDSVTANWIIGGVAITKPIVNFYFTEYALKGHEFSTLDTKTTNSIFLFAVQIAIEVDYEIEFKEDGEDSVGLCIYPTQQEEKIPINLN